MSAASSNGDVARPARSGPGAAALEARGVVKVFDGKRANDGVDFAARRGEVHALLGENGAGKTTLISILCGSYRPDAGTIAVDGRTVEFRSPADALRVGIGAVHQDFRLVHRFSVAENVLLGTRDRVSRSTADRLQATARELGFALDPATRVADLTVGEQQQVAILKLLYRGLDILILDEPTAVLGPQECSELFRTLRRLAAAGKAIVFITHKLYEVAEVADTVTVLRRGCVVASLPVADADPRRLASLMVGEGAVADGVATDSRGPAPADEVLALAGARCSSRGSRSRLDGVDLVLRRGEIVGVAGVSGNGQRELAEVVAGVLPLDAGERRAGSDRVGFIPENRLPMGLVPSMTVAENLALRRYRAAPISGRLWLSKRRIRQLAQALGEQYAIPTTQYDERVAKLSGGGLQRVLVARELSEEPDVLVASQPTRGLDVAAAAGVRAALAEAARRGCAVLLVSEDIDELLELADRIVVMLEGRLVADVPRAQASRATLGEHMVGAGERGAAAGAAR